METFVSCWCVEVEGKSFSPVAFIVQLGRQVLVLLHILRLVRAKLDHFNFVLGKCVCVSCYYGKVDGAALGMLHHPSLHRDKESSCRPAGM